jgi:hypothetical protein
MNVSATSSFLSPLAANASLQTPSVNNASDPDGDGDGGGRVHHHSHRGGGQMHQALTQALQSLGLSMPQGTTGAGASSQTSASSDSDGNSNGSSSATSSVKQDMRQFMHALFQAVKSESAPGASNGSDPTSTKTSFADGLSALISQVGNGTAPSDLQTAFTKLAADLQPAAAPVAGAATTTGTADSAAPQATLQALLTALQQDLGYGSSTAPAVGNSISTQA